MSTWVTHLMIADEVLKEFPDLCRHEFCVGNIAPDCNVENEDWTVFTPSREMTHWMTGRRKTAADCNRFIAEYYDEKSISTRQENSFLLGYYSHLITDAEHQRYIRDEERIKAVWDRIRQIPDLLEKAAGMPENWDSVKMLIDGKERMKDIFFLEREYLDAHPDSGYFTEIMGLTSFPDYLDYLPQGAIARKVKIMEYLPEKAVRAYPFIGISKEEFFRFIKTASNMVIDAIRDKITRI